MHKSGSGGERGLKPLSSVFIPYPSAPQNGRICPNSIPAGVAINMNQFRVFTRWRPLASSDGPQTEIKWKCEEHANARMSMSLVPSGPNSRPWKSEAAFTQVFEASDNNQSVFDAVVAPTLPEVLKGHCSNFFAYGHSGSGKSHTIMGYDFNNPHEFGMCLAAAHHLFGKLEALNEGNSEAALQLGIGLRMYELRNKTAFDLLNGRCNCHIREGYDGQTHIRGETEVLENGKVRVRPIIIKACWSFDDLRRELLAGLVLRATGTSTVHDQSSRTHAVVELEIVTRALLDTRNAVIERQSELVPVAKRATDIYLEENLKGHADTRGKVHPQSRLPD